MHSDHTLANFTTTQVNGKVGNSTPAPSQTPEPTVTKICIGDYVGDPYPYAKFHHDTITPSLCPPNMRKCASSDSASFYRAACNADAVL